MKDDFIRISNTNELIKDTSKKKRLNNWVENPIFSNHARLIPFSFEYWTHQLKEYLGTDFKNKRLLLPNKLEFFPVSKSEYRNIPYVVAIDTETFARNGNL